MMQAQIRAKLRRWQFGIVPGLTMMGLILLIRSMGLLQLFEWSALDFLLRHRPDETLDERIVIVGIDESDIKRLRQYPVSDAELARAIATLQQYHPRAIGLDIVRDLPVEPGYRERKKVFRDSRNLIVIEKVLAPTIAPPDEISPVQVGFSDAIPDLDGQYRRILLGSPTRNGYKFSFALRLAQAYLAQENIFLGNGIDDSEAMRLGQTEFPRFLPNTGGYSRTDAGGVQMLLNYRSGKDPFRVLSLNDIQTKNFEPQWLEGKVILIGMTSPSTPDLLNTDALVNSKLHGQIYGVEFQAHGVSQMLNAVLDGRPLLKTASEGWEYFWIIFWGILGIYLSRLTCAPVKNLLAIMASGVLLIGICYSILLGGWWLPLVPSLSLLVLNGVVLTAFYQYEEKLQVQIAEQQRTIDRTFTAIHNGPLQTLAIALRSLREKEDIPQADLLRQLETLNREIRDLGEYLKQESLTPNDRLRLGSGLDLDARQPLHELFYEVYSSTLERDLPHFATLRVKIRSFEPLDSARLTIEQKHKLCQFLEEAICNVGKHASGVVQLSALGSWHGHTYILSITDNGMASDVAFQGRGTKQGQNLARQLGGTFRRDFPPHGGTSCQLSWPMEKPHSFFGKMMRCREKFFPNKSY